MKVLCIGHATYDITLPMDGYPTENKKIRIDGKKIECGGGPAATAAYLLSKWHLDTSFAGIIGNDYYGQKIEEEFKKVGVNLNYLEKRDDINTTSSYIVANSVNGSRTILTCKDDKKFKNIKEIKDHYDYILVDGDEYELSKKILTKGKSISIIDAGKCNKNIIELGHLVNYFVCSSEFASNYTNIPLDYKDLNSIKKMYDKLSQDFKKQVIIITLESHGSFTKIDDEYYLVPGIKVKAIDSTGAGDIYHGSLLYFISQGYNLLDSMKYANITAGISVTRLGGRYSIPNLEEVLSYDK